MSFCMSGAVCCVLMLGSLSGVALGYNYSLAEYMDLKETNVSVYLKRGVFDDEGMSDDMNFRRSGEEEGPEQMPTGQRRLGNQDDSGPLSSGRQLDDSLMQSNQNHGYEGGLMKLTIAPPYPITTTTPMPISDAKVAEIFRKHAPGSLDQLKDFQSLVNYRKALAAREPGAKTAGDPLIAGYPASLINEESYVPPHILNAQPSPGRRAWQAPSTNSGLYNTWQDYLPGKMHPALMAVPPPGIRERQYWEAFKQSSPQLFEEHRLTATSPRAIRLNTLGSDMYPTEPPKHSTFTEETEPPTQLTSSEKFMNIGLDSGGGQFDHKMILDKYGTSGTKSYGRILGKEDITPKSDSEYYDDDIKGLPVRKKRHIHGIKRKSNGQNFPTSEHEKAGRENFHKINDITYTDPNILISKLESKYTSKNVNTEAKDLTSQVEETPLYNQIMNTKMYETESRILMKRLLGKARDLHKINNKMKGASSAHPDFINQRRFVFSFL